MEILVTGLARSGTTWLAKILDSHPDTRYLHEPDSIPLFSGIPPVVVESESSQYTEAIASTLTTLESAYRVNSSGSWPVFRERGASLGVMARLPQEHFQSLLNLDLPQVRSIQERCTLTSRLDLESLRWAVLSSLAVDLLSTTPNGLIVRYEDITRSPLEEARKIVDFVGLS